MVSISSAYSHVVSRCTWVSKKGSRKEIVRNNLPIVALFRRSGAPEFGSRGEGHCRKTGVLRTEMWGSKPNPLHVHAHFISDWGYLTSAMEPSLWI